MSKQRVVNMEQLRQQSIQAWAQANRQAMHEAVRNTSVNQAPAAAAGASGVGGGGEGIGGGLYQITTSGRIYSFDSDVEFPIGGGFSAFPQQAICCDRGDGSFYYLFFWEAGFFFGTIDAEGTISIYEHNIDDVADTGTPMSLYLEPDGNLIMVDSKDKSIFNKIIRIVPNAEQSTATATLVKAVGDLNQSYKLHMLFTYNGDVYAMSTMTSTPYERVIGRYDITQGDFVPGATLNTMYLYRNGQLSSDGSPNYWSEVSVVQARNGTVYMTAFYPDPVTLQYEFGIFEVQMTGQAGIQRANWVKDAYPANNQTTLTLFNGYASTYVEPPQLKDLILMWDPIGPNNSNTPLIPAHIRAGYAAGELTIVGMPKSQNTDVWPVGAVSGNSIDTSKYLEFSVSVPAITKLKTITYTKRSYFDITSNAAAIRSSVNSFASNITQISVNAAAGTQTLVFDISSLPLIDGTVTFRIYFWGATGQDWLDLVSEAANPAGTGLQVFIQS
jgi:hypothetical protein